MYGDAIGIAYLDPVMIGDGMLDEHKDYYAARTCTPITRRSCRFLEHGVLVSSLSVGLSMGSWSLLSVGFHSPQI
ncbi:hypothetical protein PsorP6_011734 [Peronosclerospora sorghi]|uniref:Uncharacterized protein n=1 Tax=Peronosclerospora sorghi TaxID=230839 RepID=A0ACC0WKF5_9STRA|nr:hypothetical protein PsorP6_011734 [Peronosclerospora sorghi]